MPEATHSLLLVARVADSVLRDLRRQLRAADDGDNDDDVRRGTAPARDSGGDDDSVHEAATNASDGIEHGHMDDDQVVVDVLIQS